MERKVHRFANPKKLFSYLILLLFLQIPMSGFGQIKLSEDFAKCIQIETNTDLGTTPNFDNFTQLPGWTGVKVYQDIAQIKIGSSTALGYVITPTVDLSGNSGAGSVKFDAMKYSTDATSIQIFHAPDGTTFTQIGVDQALTGTMATYTFQISGGTSTSKIKIAAISASKKRFYLDNIIVTSGVLKSKDATLASLTPSNGTLEPTFSPSVLNYSVSLPAGTTSVPTLTYTTTSAQATSTVTNATSLPGTSSVSVTAEDGTTLSYAVAFSVLVEISHDANLKTLVPNQGTLTPNFDPSVYEYTVTLPYSTSTPSTVTATADMAATMEITNPGSTAGEATIKVTAQDGTTIKNYKVTFSKSSALKISALKTLAIDKGTLSPAFEPAVLRYTSTLPYGTATVTVSATVSETSFATVTIQQANVTSTVEANRSAVVKVTAEDGVTESVYSIAFSVETVDPNVVATVAELRSKEPGNTIYTLTGEVVMSFAGDYRSQKFVQDATGGIVIDDYDKVITSTYSIGDGIKGLKGKLTLFRGLLEFIPTEDPGAASSAGNTIVPKTATISELPNLQGQLVKITGLSFTETGNFVTTTATNYTLTSEENSTVVLRTAYKNVDYEGKAIPTEKVNVIALVYCYNTPQLMLRAYADISISSGLKNAEELGVSVYPNPVIDMLTINQASNIDHIELYNTEGKKLVSKKCKSESITLDMHNFNSGIYLLNLHSKDGKSAIVKILK
jgi:hypothetical protein